ncbi:transposase mutator type [Collinsella sp. CAG:398]|nr:transposase mutator type [Collinsella sp. CAG:398]
MLKLLISRCARCSKTGAHSDHFLLHINSLNREIRRRTRVVGTFPDGKSALMLVTARLKYVAKSEWGSRRYLDVTLLDE